MLFGTHNLAHGPQSVKKMPTWLVLRLRTESNHRPWSTIKLSVLVPANGMGSSWKTPNLLQPAAVWTNDVHDDWLQFACVLFLPMFMQCHLQQVTTVQSQTALMCLYLEGPFPRYVQSREPDFFNCEIQRSRHHQKLEVFTYCTSVELFKFLLFPFVYL